MYRIVTQTTERLKSSLSALKKASADIRYKYVLITSIFSGLISYLYLMTNNIHNYDSIGQTPCGVGATITSGRWWIHIFSEAQTAFGGGYFYNTTVINIVLALFFLTLSCMLLVSVLELESRLSCVAITAVTVCFPTIATTMLFHFTIHIYCCAIFLGIAGIWFAKRKNVISFFWGGTYCLLYRSISGVLRIYCGSFASGVDQ